jgi:opacity protein-like surface antigen
MRRIAGRSFASALSFAVLTAASASAQESLASRTELSLMGGIQTLNQNDTGLPDNIVNVPAVGTLGYRLSRNWAIEGEFSWLIPVQQQVEGAASTQDMKTPDILAYQANLRADLPQASWSPYLAAGLGAVTFLSNTNADVVPQLAESQTAFAINFGGGVAYPLSGRWGLRADFRELVAFPASDAVGLSSGGNADPIWMERGTLGLAYRF